MRPIAFITIIIVLGLYSCSHKTLPYSGEVNFLYKESQGTIAVKSIGYGNNRNKAIEDAEKNAFNILLFKGIPGTDLNVPLINDENAAKTYHSDYFTRFFDEGYYKTFMMSSTISSNLIRSNGRKKIYVDIKINYNSLRKDLGQNQVIRNFGF